MRPCSDSVVADLARTAGYVRFDGTMAGRPEILPAGHPLFTPEDPALHVYAALPPRHSAGTAPVFARVEFPVPPPGKPTRLERIDEDRLFGEFEFLLSGLAPTGPGGRALPRLTAGVLMTPGLVIAIPLDALAAAAEEDPRLRRRLVQLGVSRLHEALTAETRARHLGGDVGLADYLLRLADDYGTFAGNYTALSKRVTGEEMAQDLGISRRALTDRLGAWSEAGLIRTAPLALLDIRRIEQLRAIGSRPPGALIADAATTADRLLDAGNPAAAQRLALDLLRHFPSAPALVLRAGLAAARSGRSEDAGALLAAAGFAPEARALYAQVLTGLIEPGTALPDPLPDAETLDEKVEDAAEAGGDRTSAEIRAEARHLTSELLALHARIAKDRAVESEEPADYEAAAESYAALDAFTGARGYGTANAAMLRLAAGDRAGARDLAARIERARPAADYWSHATALEAALILGETEAAAGLARAADALPRTDGMLAATRRQVRLFAPSLGLDAGRVLGAIEPRRPIVYSGTMIRDGQFDGATAAEVEAHVARAAEAVFRDDRIGAAFGPLAQGGDMLIAEAALEAGVELNIVLPFEIDSYIEQSVAIDAEAAGWRQRFEAVLNEASSVSVAQTGKPFMRDLDISFRHGFRIAAAEAIQRAEDLETTPILVAVSAAGAAGQLAGTSADTADWQALHHDTEIISLPWTKLRTSGTERLNHGFGWTVFHFPEKGAETDLDGIAPEAEIVPRVVKGGRRGAALILPTIDRALDVARRLPGRAEGRARVICDYGPVMNNAGRPGSDLIARLPGAADFPDLPGDRILATTGFVGELRFAGLDGPRAQRLGQRLHGGSAGRARIVPTFGVHALDEG